MCGIFGGTLLNSDIATKGINLINRGLDGITIEKLEENIFFAARRHLVKKSGKNMRKIIQHQINHINPMTIKFR